jgi:very-short-patch-repair endonuclease
MEPPCRRTILPAPRSPEKRAGSGSARDPGTARQVRVLGVSRKIIVSGSRDARVAAIAAQQRGRVARRQLLAGGLTAGQIHHLLRSDRLFRMLSGVYAVGSPAPVALGRETSALLAVREGALLSHITAARLWGLLPAGSAPDEPVHVMVDDGWIPHVRGVRGHHSRILAPRDRCVRDRLAVCAPARVLLDLAPELDARSLGRAIDEGRLQNILVAGDLAELLDRAGGHPGAGALRAVLAAADLDAGVTESEAERRLRSLLVDADLARPQRNAWVTGYRLDSFWPDARLAVEVDGYRVHSLRSRFEGDRTRDARLDTAGVKVLHVTWRQMEREPLAVIARIAAALARRTVQDVPR